MQQADAGEQSPHPDITLTEEARREAVLEAMGSFALEGMQPSADTVAWARDYIAGRLTTAQILERLKRKYGVD